MPHARQHMWCEKAWCGHDRKDGTQSVHQHWQRCSHAHANLVQRMPVLPLHTRNRRVRGLPPGDTPVLGSQCLLCLLLAHVTMLHCYIVMLPCLQELFEPLHLMYTSLLSTGDESTANHKLLDTLRQVGTGWQLQTLLAQWPSGRHCCELCASNTCLSNAQQPMTLDRRVLDGQRLMRSCFLGAAVAELCAAYTKTVPNSTLL